MAQPTGIWIDRRRALILDLAARPVAIRAEIVSDVDEQRGPHEAMRHVAPHQFGGSRAHHMERRRENALREFYQRVADAVQHEEAVVIGGPNGAGAELAALLGAASQGPRVVAVSPLDTHLTDHEIIERLAELGTARA